MFLLRYKQSRAQDWKLGRLLICKSRLYIHLVNMKEFKKTNQMFPCAVRRRNKTTQQSAAILHLYLRTSLAAKSQNYLDVSVFKELRFKMFSFHTETQSLRQFSVSSGIKSFFEKLRFRDGFLTIRPMRRNRMGYWPVALEDEGSKF